MIGRVQPAAAVLDEAGLGVSATDNAAEWDANVASHRHATAYHQWGWRVVFREAFGHPSHYLIARRNGRVTGGLPLVEFRSRLFGAFAVSLPFVNYGGVVADDDETAAALVAEAVSWARARGLSHVELRHLSAKAAPWPAKRHKVAMWLPLERDETGAVGGARSQGAEPGPQGREGRARDRDRGRRAARRVLSRLFAQHARSRHAGLQSVDSSRRFSARFPTARACSSCQLGRDPDRGVDHDSMARHDRSALGLVAARAQRQVAKHAPVLDDVEGGDCGGRDADSTSAARLRTRGHFISSASGVPRRSRWCGNTPASRVRFPIRARRTRSSGWPFRFGSGCPWRVANRIGPVVVRNIP